ncbi:sugar-binding protein [Puniceicoccus vermicola]|uniref:Carbohydrate-binding domain-containing protein n=1 Tax=Puniceicoccus vermicola TaxID=388746 RepID=A0A7X1AZC4_9BACT|nr:sugar-binding protein [Puniceicoccus vermicola]MBC2602746.1 hypothetical protein [Puniceicoccus vermicola]
MKLKTYLICSSLLAGGFMESCLGISVSRPEKLEFSELRGFRNESNEEWVTDRELTEEVSLRATFAQKVEPGWYQLVGEYRTTGFRPDGRFVLDVYGEGVLNPWQVVAPSDQWAPFAVYFRLNESVVPVLRIEDPSKFEKGAEVFLKELRIRPFEVPSGQNLLLNSDFEIGQIGWVPPSWQWAYQTEEGVAEIVESTSFRSGERSLFLGDPEKTSTIQSSLLPMKTNGVYTFSFWARSDRPNTVIKAFLLGDRYNWNSREEFRLTSEWKEYSMETNVAEQVKEHPFCHARLSLADGGSAMIDDVRLIWAEENSESENPSTYVDLYPGNRNMVWNPGFELGMNGWMYNFFGNQYDFGINTPGIRFGSGIDGSAAMLLSNNNSLVSGSMPLEEGKSYTLSAYAKALADDAQLSLFVIDPGWNVFRKGNVNLTTGEWRRVSFHFRWNESSLRDKFYARFDGRQVLLDNVQLEEGDLSEYDAGILQAGLVSSSRNFFLQGEQNPELNLKILANSQKYDSVRAFVVVRDAWGNSVGSSQFNVEIGEGENVVPLSLPGESLGVFDIEAKVEDFVGNLLVRCESRYAVLQEARFSDDPIGIFSSAIEIPKLPDWMIAEELTVWRMLGVQSFRSFFNHGNQEGLTTNSDLIESIRRRLELQMEGGMTSALFCVGVIPHSIRSEVLDAEILSNELLSQYTEYLRGVVTPLRGQVKYWEILNEPNIWRYRSGPKQGVKTMPPEKYAQILKVSYETIKEIDPQLQVVGGCLNGADFSYLQEFLDLGGSEYMDVFSYHSYRASPDLPDVYADLLRFKNMLSSAGFTGPVINSEQYFGADKFIMAAHDSEAIRNYFSPDERELEAASKIIRNYLYHSALGIPYYLFTPPGTLFRYGGYDRYYLYYAFGLYNAATRFLVDAGIAEEIEVGSAMRSFLFPDAQTGPLLTVNTVGDFDTDGQMTIAASCVKVFDPMGNEIASGELKKSFPLSPLPVYLRFPEGTKVSEIEAFLREAEILGLGEPFTAELRMIDSDTLGISISNRLNKTIGGRVELTNLPFGWSLDSSMADFESLQPGEETVIEFEGDLKISAGERYSLTALIQSEDKAFVRKEMSFSPLMISRNDAIVSDGDLSEWNQAQWVTLGENHRTVFDPKKTYGGEEDLSASLGLAWSPEYLAIAVVVKDDLHVTPNSPSAAWKFDSLQLYFDQRNNASIGNDFYDGDDVSYAISSIDGEHYAWLEKNSEGRYVGEANQAQGLDREVEVSVVRGEDGVTVYEILIPRVCLPQVDFSSGQVFGFSLIINDNDGEGRAQALTLTPAGTQPFERPYLYHDVFLIENRSVAP